ncbi:MAG: hypothetical protein VX246_14720 [Myxococcota bacterium]|nr:hypothetical protein [Myxococcota bacterium]
MSYLVASYGITLIALGGYAWNLFREHRRLLVEDTRNPKSSE